MIGFKGDIIFDSNMPEGVMRKYLDSSRLQRMGWKAKTFKNKYEKYNHAFFCGNVNYYPVSNLSSLVIKTENLSSKSEPSLYFIFG